MSDVPGLSFFVRVCHRHTDVYLVFFEHLSERHYNILYTTLRARFYLLTDGACDIRYTHQHTNNPSYFTREIFVFYFVFFFYYYYCVHDSFNRIVIIYLLRRYCSDFLFFFHYLATHFVRVSNVYIHY